MMLKSVSKALFLCLVVTNVFSCTPVNKPLEKRSTTDLGIIISSEIEELDNIEGYKYFHLLNSDVASLKKTGKIEYGFSDQITVFENSENNSPGKKQNEYLLVIANSDIESELDDFSKYQELLNAVGLNDTFGKKTNLIVMVNSTLCASADISHQILLKSTLKNNIVTKSNSTNLPLNIDKVVCPNTFESTNFFIPRFIDPHKPDDNLTQSSRQQSMEKPSLIEFVKSLEEKKSNSIAIEESQLGLTNKELLRFPREFRKDYITFNLEYLCAYNKRNGENEAKVERNRQSLQQLAVFQMTYSRLGIMFDLSNASETCIQETSDWLNSFLRSIQELQKNLNRMGLLANNVRADIYDFDQQSNQFAYMLKGDGNQRAFINFNFSFDAQTMLLPLGFMNSSKIDLWQSDTPKVVTFVTNENIATRPLSASVIMMN